MSMEVRLVMIDHCGNSNNFVDIELFSNNFHMFSSRCSSQPYNVGKVLKGGGGIFVWGYGMSGAKRPNFAPKG